MNIVKVIEKDGAKFSIRQKEPAFRRDMDRPNFIDDFAYWGGSHFGWIGWYADDCLVASFDTASEAALEMTKLPKFTQFEIIRIMPKYSPAEIV